MNCAFCWQRGVVLASAPVRRTAEMVVNGHAVCAIHVVWAQTSNDFEVCMLNLENYFNSVDVR
jgi:hypothetical protein